MSMSSWYLLKGAARSVAIIQFCSANESVGSPEIQNLNITVRPDAEQVGFSSKPKFSADRKGGTRSLSRVLSWTTIPLGVLLPARSSSLPGSGASHAIRFPIWPCFRWGLPCRPCYHVRGELLPRSGFRLTAPACAGAPFHPCRPGFPRA